MAFDANKPVTASNNPLNDPNWDTLTQAQRDTANKVDADKAAADRKARGQ
jgi:hypothetical protein